MIRAVLLQAQSKFPTFYQFYCIDYLRLIKPSKFPKRSWTPLNLHKTLKTFPIDREMAETSGNEQTTAAITNTVDNPEKPLSKNAQKKLKKQQRYEEKKAEKKAIAKEQRKAENERKQKEWEEKLAALVSEEEKLKFLESRKELRKERMEKRSEEKEKKFEKLSWGKLHGQRIVIDLEFSHLMSDSQLRSLVQQIMFCYAVNGKCTSPCHLWLTGCEGNMETQLRRIPGFDKWMVEKESRSYIEALQDKKDSLVYLTADSETVLEDLDPKKMYIIGGIVDRNRWKGITMTKAQEQGIQTARLPIGNYLKMSTSQVLTVNQVVEILLKYLEIKDWKASFFQVIPQRKRCEAESSENGEHLNNEDRWDRQKKLKMSEINLEEKKDEDRLDGQKKLKMSEVNLEEKERELVATEKGKSLSIHPHFE